MAGSGWRSVAGDTGPAQALHRQDDGALRPPGATECEGGCAAFGEQCFTLPEKGAKEVMDGGAASKAAIQQAKVLPCQLLVSDT